jgi:hypothetical protein
VLAAQEEALPSEDAARSSEDWRTTINTVRFSTMINVFTRGWDE